MRRSARVGIALGLLAGIGSGFGGAAGAQPVAAVAPAAAGVAGDWDGVLSVQGLKLRLAFTSGRRPAGRRRPGTVSTRTPWACR